MPELCAQQKTLEETLKTQQKKQVERVQASKVAKDLSDEAIISELKAEGLIPKGATVEKSFQNNVNRLIFLAGKDDNGQEYSGVVKVVPSNPEEHKKLIRELNLVQIANELKKTHKDTPLPIITGPRGGLMIGDYSVMVLEKAEGEPLKDLFEQVTAMSDEAVKKMFFNIGEQSGNLDRLFYDETGGILWHRDSHVGNFLYDEKTGQLYWIDTEGLKIAKGISSSLLKHKDVPPTPYLRFFGSRINQVGGIGPAKQEFNLDAAIAITFLEIRKKMGDEISKLDFQERVLLQRELSSINIDSELFEINPRSVLESIVDDPDKLELDFGHPEALKVVKQLVSQEEYQKFIDRFDKIVQWGQKGLLALKSFGEGYIKGNPQAKETFNTAIEESKKWNVYTNRLVTIAEILGLKQPQFIDPLLK